MNFVHFGKSLIFCYWLSRNRGPEIPWNYPGELGPDHVLNNVHVRVCLPVDGEKLYLIKDET